MKRISKRFFSITGVAAKGSYTRFRRSELQSPIYMVTIGFFVYTDSFSFWKRDRILSFTLEKQTQVPFGSVCNPFPCRRYEIIFISYPKDTDLFYSYFLLSCKRGPKVDFTSRCGRKTVNGKRYGNFSVYRFPLVFGAIVWKQKLLLMR